MSKPYDVYVENALVKQNSFIKAVPQNEPLPTFDAARAALPEPTWDGHGDAIRCYWKVWELAFKNLRRPTPQNGFVSNYIDTAFNDCLFMWDSCFILMFGRYGSRVFDFQHTLDNLYAKQHPDGYICREIDEADGGERFTRFDPTATGPNVMPWSEWEYYQNFGDKVRLAKVFPVLLAYHQWLAMYHTWQDGTYWSSGWGCGMDNQPRIPAHLPSHATHAHMSWIDACQQQVLSARLLVEMANILGRQEDAAPQRAEIDRLNDIINRTMWDEKARFYFDRRADGSLNGVKSIGAFWGLLAECMPADRAAAMVDHLKDERTFNRPHRVPTLSADHPIYDKAGGYWLGAIWSPTQYMVLRGLTQVGQDQLAFDIAMNHLDNVTEVFRKTGTVWENYAPESAAPGDPARKDFVGWSGVGPVTVLFEYAFGLRPSAGASRLVWDVRLLDEHGVKRYPLGKHNLLDLHCAARKTAKDRPVVKITAKSPVEVELRWAGGSEILNIKP